MKVGIQLYSVRNSMAQDPVGTIRKVAETGYRSFEVANGNTAADPGVGFGVPVKEMRALLGDLGANIFSAHLSPLDPAQMDPILEYHKEIGTKFFVQPIDFFADRDAVLREADRFNRVGERCREYGMEFLYHNHYHEFQTLGGEQVYETIMKNTDPELVKIELDTYWVMRGAHDPIETLKRYGKRVRLVHQKDYPKGMEAQIDLLSAVEAAHANVDMQYFIKTIDPATFTEIGTGMMDIQGIIDTAATACDCAYIVLEQDISQHDELESIRISMDSFKKFRGIEW